MEGDKSLRLTDREIAQTFADPEIAAKFPPVLTMEKAAELMAMKLGTLRDWRSRGLLHSCAVKAGKEVKIYRNRFIKAVFNDLIATIDE